LAWRFLAAAVGVVLLSGGATYVIARNEVSRLVEALKQHPPVKVAPHVLTATHRGAPETLLLVGNDERKLTQYYHNEVLPHSNEMLLVRINPSQPTISMLSIPRELKVPIQRPNGEVVETRLNAAYQFGWENGGGTGGGVKLMVETIKHVLGLREINGVFVTNFHKFAKAVNAMGCVYMTVDKHYEHTNEPGGEQYFEIHLKPGYQKLCGEEALEFVANRHESTSLIRDARDQRFLLEAKAEYGPSLIGEREKFEDIFGKYVENTLNEEQILQLIYLLIESAGKPVRQVHFNVTFDEGNFDSATPEQIHEALSSFLNGTAPITNKKLNATAHPATRIHHGASGGGFALTPTPPEELAAARAQAPNLPFPLEYPRVRDSFASAEPDELRLYQIHDLHGHVHTIYCIVISRGELGQYYDVQGTTWTDPPVLSHVEQTVHLGSRTYELSYVGEQVKTIAWREDGAVYWIENTLANSVSPHVMLDMAEHTVPVIHTRLTQPVALPTTPSTAVDLTPRTATATSLSAKIEALLGFLGLGVVALLALIVLARWRELILLREQIADAMTLEARRHPLLATGGVGLAAGTPATEPPAKLYRVRKGTLAAESLSAAQAQVLGAHPRPVIASASIPAPAPAPTIYKAPKGRGRAILTAAGVVIALVILAALAVNVIPANLSRSSAPNARSLPVAVFNATGTPGAAHGIADQLKAGHVHLGQIGNVNVNLRAGVYVLYPPGAQAQARRVAQLIPNLSPTVQAIQPEIQNAVGPLSEIVVVFN
jgi:polyisoprenyl-teichoic acid--peptidoglycan teichoic acid transferase